MVNPGIFKGARKEFLLGEKAGYEAAIDGGFQKDNVAQIQRRYFKRFPPEMPHDQEPSAENLAAIDDEAADPEPVVPDEENLSPEEYLVAMKEFTDRVVLLKKRKEQIARWMGYQYMKDHEGDFKDAGAKNPYAVMLHQLTGVSKLRPRLVPANKLWRKTQRDKVEAEVVKRANAGGISKKQLAPIREKVVKEMFDALDVADRQEWARIAKKDHDEAMEKFEKEIKKPPPTDPESRQRSIQNLTQFMQPIMDLVCEATGWKLTLIAGGPEPAHDGRLNMLSIHCGTTTGDVKMNFGRCEQAGFKNHIVPTFSSFLRKCYTPEECRSRALPSGNDFDPIANLELASAEVHSIDPEGSQTSAPSNPSVPLANRPPTPRPASAASSTGSSPPSLRLTPTPSLPLSPTRGSTPLPSPILSPLRLTPEPAYSPNQSRQQSPAVPSRLSTPAIPEPHVGSPATAPPSLPLTSTQHIPQTPLHLSTTLAPTIPLSKTPPPTKKRKADVPQVEAANHPQPKRRKDEGRNLSPHSEPPANPGEDIASTEPQWFLDLLNHFRSHNYGVEWAQLLKTWAAFEKHNHYQETGRLKAKSRPKVVSDWIKSGRPIPWRAAGNVKVKSYGSELSQWWVSLQPDWRLDSDGTLDSSKEDGDWSQLKLPGLNGIITFLAGLYAWACSLKDPSKSEGWIALVSDCHLALGQLLEE